MFGCSSLSLLLMVVGWLVCLSILATYCTSSNLPIWLGRDQILCSIFADSPAWHGCSLYLFTGWPHKARSIEAPSDLSPVAGLACLVCLPHTVLFLLFSYQKAPPCFLSNILIHSKPRRNCLKSHLANFKCYYNHLIHKAWCGPAVYHFQVCKKCKSLSCIRTSAGGLVICSEKPSRGWLDVCWCLKTHVLHMLLISTVSKTLLRYSDLLQWDWDACF